MIDKNDDQMIQPVPLKWIFIYKFNENGYFSKYKTRLVIKKDFQKMNIQDVYAVTLIFKVFRFLMIFVVAFDLKTRQLNAVNAFLNAKNDDSMYCFLSDDYKKLDKIMKMLRALYDQRKSPLLWLRILSMKCIEMKLHQISKKSCLFINENGVIFFFYVNDIVIASRPNQRNNVDAYVKRLMKMFEIRDLSFIKFFFGIRIIRNHQKKIFSLVQNTYMKKLMKEYEIDISKSLMTSISVDLEIYEDEVIITDIHQYKKMMKSICYSTVDIKSDVIKTASKLSKFFINSGLGHIKAAMQCLCYLYATRHLSIQFSAKASDGGHLMTQISIPINQMFEATVDASYANYLDRKNGEGYTFRLFDSLIDWIFRKQTTVITSIIEAKLLSFLHAGKELIWWNHLFQKMRFDTEENLIICNDNLQTIRLLNSEIFRFETKFRHVDIFQCWLKQKIQMSHINIDYIPTAKMMTDGLTKMLSPQKHQVFVKQLGLKDLGPNIMKLKGAT